MIRQGQSQSSVFGSLSFTIFRLPTPGSRLFSVDSGLWTLDLGLFLSYHQSSHLSYFRHVLSSNDTRLISPFF